MMHSLELTSGQIDPRQLRSALGRYATGVTVITTCLPDGKLEGLTANSFAALSLDPPLVLWSLRREAPSLGSFLQSGRFAINVLASDQHHLSRHFSTPKLDKFQGLEFSCGPGGCPLLNESLAWFDCRTENTVEGGDHLIFIGRVERAAYRDGEPLIFHAGQYCVPSQLEARPSPLQNPAKVSGMGGNA